jgi:hypothetical protein
MKHTAACFIVHDLSCRIHVSVSTGLGDGWAPEPVQTLCTAQFQPLLRTEPVSPAALPAAVSLHGPLAELSRHQSHSGAKFTPCHSSGGYSPAFQHGDTGSIQDQILWDLWWTKW